jgi:hypothetical protein
VPTLEAMAVAMAFSLAANGLFTAAVDSLDYWWERPERCRLFSVALIGRLRSYFLFVFSYPRRDLRSKTWAWYGMALHRVSQKSIQCTFKARSSSSKTEHGFLTCRLQSC